MLNVIRAVWAERSFVWYTVDVWDPFYSRGMILQLKSDDNHFVPLFILISSFFRRIIVY